MSWEKIFSLQFLIELGISIGIFLLFLGFRRIFTKYVFTLLLKFVNKKPNGFLSQVFRAFEKPIQWLFLIIGINVTANYFPYFNEENALFLDIMRSSIIFIIAWGLFNLSSASVLLFAKVNEKYSFKIDQILIPFLSRILRVIIVAIAFSIIAQEFGYNISGFVAGLGIGGLALSLAAKDALANLVGGVVIITERPFSIGDWIMTPSVEGTVEDINFRSTLVRTFQQALVTVPNATLASESITNWSKMGKREVSFNIKVAQDTPNEKLGDVIKQIRYLLKNHEEIHPDSVHTRFNAYKENGFEIFVYYFTKTTNYGEYLRINEEINFDILKILENEGVSLAMQHRKLYVESEGETKERTVTIGSES
jgi:MscS family membrane protein